MTEEAMKDSARARLMAAVHSWPRKACSTATATTMRANSEYAVIDSPVSTEVRRRIRKARTSSV